MAGRWMMSKPMGSEKAAKSAPQTPLAMQSAMNSWLFSPKGLAGFGTTAFEGFSKKMVCEAAWLKATKPVHSRTQKLRDQASRGRFQPSAALKEDHVKPITS